jgi:hypothetical protein
MPHRLLQPPQIGATRPSQRGIRVAQIVDRQRRQAQLLKDLLPAPELTRTRARPRAWGKSVTLPG